MHLPPRSPLALAPLVLALFAVILVPLIQAQCSNVPNTARQSSGPLASVLLHGNGNFVTMLNSAYVNTSSVLPLRLVQLMNASANRNTNNVDEEFSFVVRTDCNISDPTVAAILANLNVTIDAAQRTLTVAWTNQSLGLTFAARNASLFANPTLDLCQQANTTTNSSYAPMNCTYDPPPPCAGRPSSWCSRPPRLRFVSPPTWT